MGKDSEKIPDLSRENHETWFVQAKLKLVGKGIFYPCIQTETQFAWEQVAWNNERRMTYARDQAKAISILGASLGTEDKVFLILHQDNARDFWNALKGKYEETNSTTASNYMTKLHSFKFQPEMGIDTAWATLKRFRQMIVSGNPALRVTYPDETLYAIFTPKLSEEFWNTSDVIRDLDISVDEKIRRLEAVKFGHVVRSRR